MNFEKELIKFLIIYDQEPRKWIRDEHVDEFNMLISEMEKAGEIQLHYDPERISRYRVVDKTEEEIDVQEFRKYFLKAYSGETAYASSKEEVTRLIKEYMAKHPGHSFDLICSAAKYYVDHCKRTGEYLMMAHNFILKDGKSRLEAAVDDLISLKTDKEDDKFGWI